MKKIINHFHRVIFQKAISYLRPSDTSFSFFQGPFVSHSFLAKWRFQLQYFARSRSVTRRSHLWKFAYFPGEFFLLSQGIWGEEWALWAKIQLKWSWPTQPSNPRWPPANPGDHSSSQPQHTRFTYVCVKKEANCDFPVYCIDYGLFFVLIRKKVNHINLQRNNKANDWFYKIWII